MKTITMSMSLGALPIFLAAGGCLERKETIRITPAGGVTIELQYSGEPQDFQGPDAMPSEGSGWRVEKQRKVQEDGKEEIILTSRRTFEPREDLPTSYAAKGDPDADLAVLFPTTLRHERRDDGVYLHFRRTYAARPWAYVNYWQEQLVDENVRTLGEKPLETLTTEEKITVLKAFAGFESLKELEFAQEAARRLEPEAKPDHWMRARQALLDSYESTDWDATVARLTALSDEEERYRVFEEESKALSDAGFHAFVTELAATARYGKSDVERFSREYERARKRWAITDAVANHAFRIRVYLPGEVVAQNADKIDDDGAAIWEFDGKALRDRAHELMITARLPVSGSGKP
ncbi:MAG: hypothetical protein AABZ12_00835 [Planctomycetota bacterium]